MPIGIMGYDGIDRHKICYALLYVHHNLLELYFQFDIPPMSEPMSHEGIRGHDRHKNSNIFPLSICVGFVLFLLTDAIKASMTGVEGFIGGVLGALVIYFIFVGLSRL